METGIDMQWCGSGVSVCGESEYQSQAQTVCDTVEREMDQAQSTQTEVHVISCVFSPGASARIQWSLFNSNYFYQVNDSLELRSPPNYAGFFIVETKTDVFGAWSDLCGVSK